MAESLISVDLSGLSLSDDIETTITVACWNIHGPAIVEYRKVVTTDTFKKKVIDKTGQFILGRADIICIQEMKFDLNSLRSDKVEPSEYFPYVGDYNFSTQQEGIRRTFNTVFFKKEKFCKLPDPAAYNSLEQRLKDRMAIAYLKIKSTPDFKFLVVSFHNFNQADSDNSSKLVLDFLKKLEVPILIAGDFNCDITGRPYMEDYVIHHYELNYLREKLKRIDFIAVRNVASSFEMCLEKTAAHDLIMTRLKKELADKLAEKKKEFAEKEKELTEKEKELAQKEIAKMEITETAITNHNPLSATIHLKKK